MSDEVLVKKFVPDTFTEVVNDIPIRDVHQSRANFGEVLVVAACGFTILLLAIIEIMKIGCTKQCALETVHKSLRKHEPTVDGAFWGAVQAKLVE